jgi:diacylglycerol kinase family enzyme
MVVAVGGDGSINEVSQSLVHSNTILGILPSGSGNGFAMHLGIGRNIKKAFQFLNEGKILTIDTCLMNDRPYVNLAGMGFDAEVSARIKGSKLRGFLGYLVYSIQEAFAYKMQDFELEMDGKKNPKELFYTRHRECSDVWIWFRGRSRSRITRWLARNYDYQKSTQMAYYFGRLALSK